MPKKGRGAGRGRGQPAIEDKKDGGEEPPGDETPVYHAMWYKNSNGFGIRAKGGKQLLAVTKKRASYDQLQAIALECIRRLAAGQELATVVAWKSVEISRL